MNPIYSIIIPHKNTPDLLRKCLASIPRRADVQIIVVDDNSDSGLVDFKSFPGLGDPYIEVYFTKEGKGAGYARNVGLDHAKGKWLVFADADDYFNPGLNEVLNKYKDDDNDIIYFKTDSIELASGAPSNRAAGRNASIDRAFRTKDWDILRYQSNYPIGKFIRSALVFDNQVKFQEVRNGNDIYFSTYTGFLAQKIGVGQEVIYTITTREDSLTGSLNSESCQKILDVTLFTLNFLKLGKLIRPIILIIISF